MGGGGGVVGGITGTGKFVWDILTLGAPGSAHAQQWLTFDLRFCEREAGIWMTS